MWYVRVVRSPIDEHVPRQLHHAGETRLGAAVATLVARKHFARPTPRQIGAGEHCRCDVRSGQESVQQQIVDGVEFPYFQVASPLGWLLAYL